MGILNSHPTWFPPDLLAKEEVGSVGCKTAVMLIFGFSILGMKYFFLLATETQFQGHAKDLAKSFNLSEIDGIVCVSGDGVLVEVCPDSSQGNFDSWYICCRSYLFSIAVAIENKSLGLGILGEEVHPPTHSWPLMFHSFYYGEKKILLVVRAAFSRDENGTQNWKNMVFQIGVEWVARQRGFGVCHQTATWHHTSWYSIFSDLVCKKNLVCSKFVAACCCLQQFLNVFCCQYY